VPNCSRRYADVLEVDEDNEEAKRGQVPRDARRSHRVSRSEEVLM
jgi:hypothetical protein